jgi:hypothetical protein
VAVSLHYSRGGCPVSLLTANVLFTRQTTLAVALGLVSLAAAAQYPGQVTKKSKDAPPLRSIAVLEWTGDEGKPKNSRLVPVTVFDGEALRDGNVYLARPQPLALAGEVEYELEKNGKSIGLYDIKNAGQEQGSWVGYGAWKPLPSAKPKPAAPVLDEGMRMTTSLCSIENTLKARTAVAKTAGPTRAPPPRPQTQTAQRSTRRQPAETRTTKLQAAAPTARRATPLPIQTNRPCIRKIQRQAPTRLPRAILIGPSCMRKRNRMPAKRNHPLGRRTPTVPDSSAASRAAMASMCCPA